MPARDFWYFTPSIRLADNAWWQVPGHQGGRLAEDLFMAPDWIIFLPCAVPGPRSVHASGVGTLDVPPGGGEPSVRGALYASKGERCGYPGDLIHDLGATTYAAAGAHPFSAGSAGAIGSGQLIWCATWWEAAVKAPDLRRMETAFHQVYPVLQFPAPGALVPFCGWAWSQSYADAEASPWPDPFPAGAFPLRVDGQLIPEIMDPLSLPAMYLSWGS